MTTVPVKRLRSPDSLPDEDRRAINDLLFNAHSDLYVNEKGFNQKLIDLLHDLGYYECNESLFLK